MSFLEQLMIRRRGSRRFSTVPPRIRHRLAFASRELTQSEDEIARQLGLAEPPRLLMVDEEEAVILTPEDRKEIPERR